MATTTLPAAHQVGRSPARLEPRELRSLHWCTLDDAERSAAPYVTRMLRRLGQHPAGTAYLEDGSDPGCNPLAFGPHRERLSHGYGGDWYGTWASTHRACLR